MFNPWRGVFRRKLQIAPPESFVDKVIRIVAMILVNPWTRKDVQGIHYRAYHGPIDGPVCIMGDPEVGDRSKGLVANFLHSDITAKNVVLLQPRENVDWHLGFSANEGGKQVTQLCAAILHGAVGVTRQGYDTDFFAVEAGIGKPLELMYVGDTTKHRLKEEIPLL